MGKTASILGIDINSRSLKLVELDATGKDYQIKKHIITPLPANAVCGKTILHKKSVIKALQFSLQQLGIKKSSAVLAIADSAVMTKLIQLDNSLSEIEIENYIFLEADHYFEMPTKEIYFDYIILGSNQHNERLLDVKIIAAARKDVTVRAEIIKAAGLQLKAVDVESAALARAAQSCQTPTLLAQIEHQSLLLGLLHNKQLVYVHAEEWQSDQDDLFIIQQIQRQLQIIALQQQIAPQQILLMGDQAYDAFAQLLSELTTIPTNLLQPMPTFMLSYGLAMWQFA